MKILRLKGVPLPEDESPVTWPQQINIRTYNASKGHSSSAQKTPKQESEAPPTSLNSGQMDDLMDQVKELNTKMFGLTSIMYTQHNRIFSKLTSFQSQMDQIQRKLEEDDE